MRRSEAPLLRASSGLRLMWAIGRVPRVTCCAAAARKPPAQVREFLEL